MAFPTGWEWKAPITIDADEVDGALTDFPVLLTEACLPSEMFDADGSNPAQNGGGDLRFSSDAAGATQLPCEVVSFVTDNNPANGTAQIHVKVPSVSASVDTTIYVWWNTAGTDSQPAASDTYGSENVWDSSYQLVLHMEQDPSGSAPQMLDSTSNGYDGTSAGSMTSGDLVTSAVGNGLDFDGSNDRIDTTAPGVTGTGARTAELLFKTSDTDATPDANQCLSWGDPAVGGAAGGSFRIPIENGVIFLRVNSGAASWGSGYNDGSWHSLAITAPASTTVAGTECFVDGGSLGAGSGLQSINTVATRNVRVGVSPTLSPAALEHFLGQEDEVRISSVVRSDAWIAATDSTLLTPGTFASAGTPVSAIATQGAALLMQMIG